jgi:hypothetical protein
MAPPANRSPKRLASRTRPAMPMQLYLNSFLL